MVTRPIQSYLTNSINSISAPPRERPTAWVGPERPDVESACCALGEFGVRLTPNPRASADDGGRRRGASMADAEVRGLAAQGPVAWFVGDRAGIDRRWDAYRGPTAGT